MTILVAVRAGSPTTGFMPCGRPRPTGKSCSPVTISIRHRPLRPRLEAGAGYLKTFPKLEAIFSLGAGVDHLTTDPDLPDLPRRPHCRSRPHGPYDRMGGAQLLLHHRRQTHYARAGRQLQLAAAPPVAASAVRVGIMGLGELGRDAAQALMALGFKVSGWSRTEKQIDGVDCFHGPEHLVPFLGRTDILVSLLPLTVETENLIGRTVIDALAKDGPLGGPVILNAGRGRSLVEADLLDALADGRLKGASLDVFATEPLPPESPLWRAPNLFLTPHVAAESDPVALSRYVIGEIAAYEPGGRFVILSIAVKATESTTKDVRRRKRQLP